MRSGEGGDEDNAGDVRLTGKEVEGRSGEGRDVNGARDVQIYMGGEMKRGVVRVEICMALGMFILS